MGGGRACGDKGCSPRLGVVLDRDPVRDRPQGSRQLLAGGGVRLLARRSDQNPCGLSGRLVAAGQSSEHQRLAPPAGTELPTGCGSDSRVVRLTFDLETLPEHASA